MSLGGLELRETIGRTIHPVAVAPAAAPLGATIGTSATTIDDRWTHRYIRSVRNDVPHARLYRHECRSQYGEVRLGRSSLSGNGYDSSFGVIDGSDGKEILAPRACRLFVTESLVREHMRRHIEINEAPNQRCESLEVPAIGH